MNLQDALISKGLAAENDKPKVKNRTEKLTPEQIKNWRKILFIDPQIGAYALVMPDEEVQALKDHFQSIADSKLSEGNK